jgi:sigma-54 dependent transcriptional regulator, acetoin dehydrogenase operon transcriptional activator AcoR
MAEGFLRFLGKDQAIAFSAGVSAGGVHPMAGKVMREAGVDISDQKSKTVFDLGPLSFDLVITLCDVAKEFCADSILEEDRESPEHKRICKSSLFIGMPTRLHWAITDPAKAEGSEEHKLAVFRSVRDQIRENISAMLNLGQLSALVSQRKQMELILDTMEDGIIVHDQHRHIYVFNRAAEKITGYKREEVLGNDCHDVFHPNGLCGSMCQLKDEKVDAFSEQHYEIGFTNKNGEDRRLMIRSALMDMPQARLKGIVATIRDVTEVSELRWKMKNKYSFHGMVGASAAMREVFNTIRQVTFSDYPVLITGESGTGKELVARAIHNESRRSAGPFVPINCGALPENILESELFGHVRGAFTGAIRDKKGRFELANNGTIFLDEVGELSPGFQVRLLRVLEEKNFELVGGERTVEVDVRVISATNRDINKMVEEGTFRIDLFYRLCVVPFRLPPLRDRREDLPLLVDQTLVNIRQETGKQIRTISDEAMELLMAYEWPGNVRELINVLQFASVRCNQEEILPSHLPPEIGRLSRGSMQRSTHESHITPKPVGSSVALEFAKAADSQKRRRRLTSEAVAQAIDEAGGNKVKAAKLLGVGRATLYRFLEKHPVS